MLKFLMDLLLYSAMNMVIKILYFEEWRVEIATTQSLKKFNGLSSILDLRILT